MTAMFDLLDTPVVPGFSLREAILTDAQEDALIAHIDGSDLTPFRFQQWTGKHLTCSYGWNYDFEHVRFAPAEPLPDWLLDMRSRAAAFAGLAADDLVQALLIRYDPGAGIGWRVRAYRGHLARQYSRPAPAPSKRRRVRPRQGHAAGGSLVLRPSDL